MLGYLALDEAPLSDMQIPAGIVVSLDLSDGLFILDPDSRILFGRELIENTFLQDLLRVSILRIRDLADGALFVPDAQATSILRIRDLLETLPLSDAMQVS